jgi:alpha-1,3/alpha-1,6-mannosyltransferase
MLISCRAHLGGYDKRLKENVDYLEELKRLAVTEGVSGQVKFVTSCSTSERNELLSNCLCVLYTPKVIIYLSRAKLSIF